MSHPWISGSVGFLERAYDPRRALFSYSSVLAGEGFTNDFGHAAVMRYTINSFLGLQEAARNGHGSRFVDSYPEMLEAFLLRHADGITDWADRGLLLVLLARENEEARTSELLGSLASFVEAKDLTDVDLQGMSWMLWGAATAARIGFDGADETARGLFRILHGRYIDRDSLLARHSLRRYRRDLVSFGGTTYHLRALFEYATLADDEYALTVFDWAVRRVMALQGPRGEWPWMISVRRADIIDPYPVFSVHQDSMAMLFLLPALERGIPGVKEAIAGSCAWVDGDNELEAKLVNEDPFFINRSIQRAETAPRLRRYLRSLGLRPDAWDAAARRRVEINPECRSYHIGWILFVWSANEDLLASSLDTGRSMRGIQ